METWFVVPKAGIARSTEGRLPYLRYFALLYLTVQRAFRSFCASFAGLFFQSPGSGLP